MELNSGDTAWILMSTALVLFMTPGLAFFYGGLVRGRNAISTISLSFVSMAVASLVWVLWGYSLAFGDGGNLNGFIGSLSYVGLNGIGIDDVDGGIPVLLFVAFQMMFAIITPALITGAIVERFKFTTYIIFLVLWLTLVYAPSATGSGQVAGSPNSAMGRERWTSQVARSFTSTRASRPWWRRFWLDAGAGRPLSRTTCRTCSWRGHPLVRLVRIQRRLRPGGRRTGCERAARYQHGGRSWRPYMGHPLLHPEQAHERRRHRHRRCRGTRGHHTGCRIRQRHGRVSSWNRSRYPPLHLRPVSAEARIR